MFCHNTIHAKSFRRGCLVNYIQAQISCMTLIICLCPEQCLRFSEHMLFARLTHIAIFSLVSSDALSLLWHGANRCNTCCCWKCWKNRTRSNFTTVFAHLEAPMSDEPNFLTRVCKPQRYVVDMLLRACSDWITNTGSFS